MKTIITFLILLAFIFGSPKILLAQNAEQLFQKGIMQEEGEGDLPEAINIFNQIVENQNADKSIQAKALLHVGLCYEKLGKEEATKAYQSLVNNYPGQKNEVAIAKERLSRLIQNDKVNSVSSVMTNKKIWEDQDIDDSGEISPDGKYLAYNDWDTGNLAVYEIATGKKRKLTNINPGQGSNYDQFAFSPKWSNDSKTIYFAVFVSQELSELRSIGLNDSNSKTICKIEGQENWLEVYDISKDGNTILSTIEIKTDTTQIALISVPDGKVNIIKEFPFAGFVENLKFTKDGTDIIYDYPTVLDSPNHDIYKLTIDGKTESPLIKHPANDFILGLSPDGGELLFASTRSGNLGFWSVGFENGKTKGIPELIKTSEYPYLKGLGFTKNGAFVYCHFPSKTDVYEVEINPSNGKVVNSPHGIVDNFVGANSTPDYSPDGKYMAFISRRLPFLGQTGRPVGNILCIKSLNDDRIREIKPGISNFGFPKWSADNRSIVVVNWEADHKMALYRINVENGKCSLMFKDENQSFSSHDLSLDGKSVFLVRSDRTGNQKLVRRDVETGKETILTEGTWKDLTNISRSADGRWIAFMGRDKNRSLKVISAEGGEIKEVHRWNQGDNRFIFHCWSPDGKYIYLSKLREPKTDLLWDIWQIPLDGSEPKNLGLELTEIWQICAHPDGKHLAYGNQGSSYKMPEVWMMENFLPLEKLAQKEEPQEPEGIKIRQIWKAPYLDDLGTVSLDGKYRSYVDWGVGNVGIHNLKTDEKKVLTNDAKLGESWQYAGGTVISKDGKRIVYSWANPYNTNALRLINVENPKPELLYKKTGEELYPCAWLSDNEIVAFRSIPDNSVMELVTFNLTDKEIKIKKTFLPGQFGWGSACSPDKKYIAYGFANKADNGNTDIRLLEINGDLDIPLITHPSNDKVLGWLPRSKEFLFISDRSGSWDLWAMKLDGTKPSGQAKRIYVNIGEVDPMGFTLDGECYFGFSRRNFYSGLAPFNKKTGEIDLEAGQSFEGQNFLITWSPDGQHLAYIKIEDNSKGNPLKLFVQDAKTGEEFQPDNNTLRVSSYKWSPDGKSILVIGRELNKLQEKDYKGGIFMVDIKTGQIDQVLLLSDYEFNRPEDDSAPLSCVEWSPDKRNVYYLFQKDRLVNHNLETGEDKIIYKFSDFSPYVLETSPDGKNLLFGLEYPGNEKSRLCIIPAEGGNEKTICTSQEANFISWAKYSPDGREIYFVELPEYNKSVLWRVSAEGGKPEKIWSPGKRVEIYDIHPDGNQVAFSIRERTTEIRVIEGLVNELNKIYSQNE